MINKIKKMFDYKRRYKHQRNKAKNLRKKVNKLSQGLSEELRLDVTNNEIRKLKLEVNRLKKQVAKLNLEAQRYFDMLMENISKGDPNE